MSVRKAIISGNTSTNEVQVSPTTGILTRPEGNWGWRKSSSLYCSVQSLLQNKHEAVNLSRNYQTYQSNSCLSLGLISLQSTICPIFLQNASQNLHISYYIRALSCTTQYFKPNLNVPITSYCCDQMDQFNQYQSCMWHQKSSTMRLFRYTVHVLRYTYVLQCTVMSRAEGR